MIKIYAHKVQKKFSFFKIFPLIFGAIGICLAYGLGLDSKQTILLLSIFLVLHFSALFIWGVGSFIIPLLVLKEDKLYISVKEHPAFTQFPGEFYLKGKGGSITIIMLIV